MISDLLATEQTQTAFDRDIFAKLVEAIRIFGDDEIVFIFKDGTEVKAEFSKAA